MSVLAGTVDAGGGVSAAWRYVRGRCELKAHARDATCMSAAGAETRPHVAPLVGSREGWEGKGRGGTVKRYDGTFPNRKSGGWEPGCDTAFPSSADITVVGGSVRLSVIASSTGRGWGLNGGRRLEARVAAAMEW